jgi:hypothetical protein
MALACNACSSGMYQSQSQQTSCITCAAQTFSVKPAQAHCSVATSSCARGKFSVSAVLGGKIRSMCKDCRSGRVQPHASQTSCVICGRGTYQRYAGQSSCHDCPAGKFQSWHEETRCLECPREKYQPFRASVDCAVCPKGKYQTLLGESSCFAHSHSTNSVAHRAQRSCQPGS